MNKWWLPHCLWALRYLHVICRWSPHTTIGFRVGSKFHFFTLRVFRWNNLRYTSEHNNTFPAMMQTGRVRGKLVEWFQLHCFVSSHRQFPPTKEGSWLQSRKTNNLQANFLLLWTFTLIQSSFVPEAKQTSAEPKKIEKTQFRKHYVNVAECWCAWKIDVTLQITSDLRSTTRAAPPQAHVISTNLAVQFFERERRGQQVRLFSPSGSKGVSAIKFTPYSTQLIRTRSYCSAWFVAHLKGHSYEANWAKIANIRWHPQ